MKTYTNTYWELHNYVQTEASKPLTSFMGALAFLPNVGSLGFHSGGCNTEHGNWRLFTAIRGVRNHVVFASDDSINAYIHGPVINDK